MHYIWLRARTLALLVQTSLYECLRLERHDNTFRRRGKLEEFCSGHGRRPWRIPLDRRSLLHDNLPACAYYETVDQEERIRLG